jgi:hypothetical protein
MSGLQAQLPVAILGVSSSTSWWAVQKSGYSQFCSPCNTLQMRAFMLQSRIRIRKLRLAMLEGA